MLLKFKVRNYKSIGSQIELNMEAGSGNEHINCLLEENGVKILPIAAIHGYNSSGKTNIIDSVCAMSYNIIESYRYGNNEKIRVTPFLYDSKLSKEPTEFEICIAVDGKEYRYGYKATREKIFEEWLYESKLSKNKTKEQIIFERTEDIINYYNKYKDLKENNKSISSKMLALSFLGSRQIESTQIFLEIYNWFAMLSNINSENNILNKYAKVYYEHKEIKNSFMKFTNEIFDPSLEDIVIEEETNTDGDIDYRILTVHGGKNFPVDIESAGIKKLFRCYVLLFTFFNTKRGVLFIDELDAHLHPRIIRWIVDKYHDKSYNKMGSQLIFSTHNLITMDNDILRRDEILFAMKNDKQFSELKKLRSVTTNLYSLSSVKINGQQVRADINYMKNYLEGRFDITDMD